MTSFDIDLLYFVYNFQCRNQIKGLHFDADGKKKQVRKVTHELLLFKMLWIQHFP